MAKFNSIEVKRTKEIEIVAGAVYDAIVKETGNAVRVVFYANKSFKKDLAVAIDADTNRIVCVGNKIEDLLSNYDIVDYANFEIEIPRLIPTSRENVDSGAVLIAFNKNNELVERRILTDGSNWILINTDDMTIKSRLRSNIDDLLDGFDVKYILNLA